MFTQDNGHNECLGNFKLKPQRQIATTFCLTDPCWWLQLWQSSLNVSYFNLFGVKVWISNLPKVQHVTIRNFLGKPPMGKSANFCVKWKFYNRATVDTYLDFLEFFIIAFSHFSIWILHLEFCIFRPQLGNFHEKIPWRRSKISV